MSHRIIRSLLLTSALLALPATAAEMDSKDGVLQMIPVDVEGGGGTLFVTPHGKSLLIDVGNPDDSRATGDHPSSERIVDVAHAFGLKKIDYLIITHYHGDHVGGIEGVFKRIPIGTVIDHGVNREVPGTQSPRGVIPIPGQPIPEHADTSATALGTAKNYETYLKTIAGHPHIIAKPGQKLSIDGMNITFVSADAKMIDKPLPGAGEQNPECANMPDMFPNGGEENTRSVGSIITFGKVKIAALGDLTWNREKDLFCPIDKVGKVDVYLMSHHGLQFSSSPALIHSLQPIVTIMGSSPTKGDNPDRVKAIEENPRFQALWRLHINKAHPEADGDHNLIANDNPDPAKDERYNLRLRINRDGDITVINERNGYNKTYKAGG